MAIDYSDAVELLVDLGKICGCCNELPAHCDCGCCGVCGETKLQEDLLYCDACEQLQCEDCRCDCRSCDICGETRPLDSLEECGECNVSHCVGCRCECSPSEPELEPLSEVEQAVLDAEKLLG